MSEINLTVQQPQNYSVTILNNESIDVEVLVESPANITFTTPGPSGPAGPQGENGTSGAGVPEGGSSNQALVKIDSANFNTQWVTLNKIFVGLSNVDNTSDTDKPVSTAVQNALNLKESLIIPGAITQYWRGDKSWQILDKTSVGLSNVDNTADLNKPISNATQTALDLKQNIIAYVPENESNKSSDISLGLSDSLYPTQKAVKNYVDNQIASATIADATSLVKGKLALSGDLSGTADAPTVPGLLTKEPTIAAGTTSQYWRGDKSWQTLNKSSVGLSNVDNTSDINKPISTLTQNALNLKQNKIETQIFILNASDISNKYVTLSSVPQNPESVNLYPEGGFYQINGEDFDVVSNIVSWSGLGLDGVLEVGEKIVIQY